jgi:hypothetical protein
LSDWPALVERAPEFGLLTAFIVRGVQAFGVNLKKTTPSQLNNLKLIDNAPDAGNVRSAANQFFVENGTCASAINAALLQMNRVSLFPRIEDKLGQLRFIDVTQSMVGAIPAAAAVLNNPSSGSPRIGSFLDKQEDPRDVRYAVTNIQSSPSPGGPTVKRPTIFVGAAYNNLSSSKQTFIAGHETIHGLFRGNHAAIARALGLSYTIGATPRDTDFFAATAIDEWLAGGCSGLRGPIPFQ